MPRERNSWLDACARSCRFAERSVCMHMARRENVAKQLIAQRKHTFGALTRDFVTVV